MPMCSTVRALAALLALCSGTAASGQLPVEVHRNQPELLASADATLAANKRLVADFWRIVVVARNVERAGEFLAAGYVEHGPGPATLVERSTGLPRAAVQDTLAELVTIVAERDLVVLAFRRELPDLEEEGQTYTTTAFELFRIADGKIVERWHSGALD